jgi:hypothetical protein
LSIVGDTQFHLVLVVRIPEKRRGENVSNTTKAYREKTLYRIHSWEDVYLVVLVKNPGKRRRKEGISKRKKQKQKTKKQKKNEAPPLTDKPNLNPRRAISTSYRPQTKPKKSGVFGNRRFQMLSHLYWQWFSHL